MASDGAGEHKCPETSLSVPECSCRRCLELMLREFSPELMPGEIKLTRREPEQAPDQRRKAA